jgi:hypothetical protein
VNRAALILLAGLAALVLAPAGAADLSQEQALAERYAPVVRLVARNNCEPGKPYLPINLNLLFGERTVALRGPWSPGDLVKIGPTANDLSKGLFQYHLDFPGSALEPGCDYLNWERRLTEGTGRRSTRTSPPTRHTRASLRSSTGSSTSSTTGTTCTKATGR